MEVESRNEKVYMLLLFCQRIKNEQSQTQKEATGQYSGFSVLFGHVPLGDRGRYYRLAEECFDVRYKDMEEYAKGRLGKKFAEWAELEVFISDIWEVMFLLEYGEATRNHPGILWSSELGYYIPRNWGLTKEKISYAEVESYLRNRFDYYRKIYEEHLEECKKKKDLIHKAANQKPLQEET